MALNDYKREKYKLLNYLLLLLFINNQHQMISYKDEKAILNERISRIEGEKLKEVLHRSIGCITYLDKDQQIQYGTGFMIASDIVITAAHNLYDKDYDFQYTDFKFYLGISGPAENYYQFSTWKFPEEFKTCPKSSKLPYDYAIMKLLRPIYFDQYLPLSVPCQICLFHDKEKQVKVYGFQAKYSHSGQNDPKLMLYQQGLTRKNRIAKIDAANFSIAYKISTEKGQSGCPVVVDNKIVAIHVGAASNQEFNFGRIIEGTLISNVQKLLLQLKGVSMHFKTDYQCFHLVQNKSRQLIMQYQNIFTIDLSPYKNIQTLNLARNNIQTIDLSFCPRLTRLVLKCNQLKGINLNLQTNISHLDLWGNKIEQIDLSANRELDFVSLGVNKLKKIDLSQNTKIKTLYLNDNCLNSIDLTKNTQLVVFEVCINKLQTIDLRNNKNLTKIDLKNNQLQQIDIQNNLKLTQLNLSFNKIKEIDLRMLPSLRKLWISNNCLRQIKLSKCLLQQIDTSSNQLLQIVIPISKEHIVSKVFTQQNSGKDYIFKDQRRPNCRIKFFASDDLSKSLQAQGKNINDLIDGIISNWKGKFSSSLCKYSYEIELGLFRVEF